MGIFNFQKVRVSHPRNAFDLSEEHLFTAPFGKLLPIYTRELQPGDKIRIRKSSFTRTQQLNTASYVKLKEEVDFFVVPMRLIWSHWPTFITNVQDQNSSLLTAVQGDTNISINSSSVDSMLGGSLRSVGNIPVNFPSFDLVSLFKTLFLFGFDEQDLSGLVDGDLDDVESLYGDILDYCSTNRSGFSPFSLLSEQSNFEGSVPGRLDSGRSNRLSNIIPFFQVNYIDEFVGFDVLRLLDHLGYGVPFFREIATSWSSTGGFFSRLYADGKKRVSIFSILTELAVSYRNYQQNGSSWSNDQYDEWMSEFRKGVSYLCAQVLSFCVSNSDSYNSFTPYLCSFHRLMAYHKIYYDFYRLSNYEGNYPLLYNADIYPQVDSHSYYSRDFFKYFLVHSRPYKKDFFTNVVPSILYYGTDDLSSLSSSDNLTPRVTNSVLSQVAPNTVLSPTVLSLTNDDDSRSTASSVGYNSSSTLSTQLIRTAFAVEKMLEITRRAGKHYDDQIRAHFGVSLPSALSNECSFIGSFINDILVREVTGTGSENLGEIGGKGISSENPNNGYIDYEAKEHCVVMGIYSTYQDVFYNSYGIDPFNKKLARSDWYQPEFDKLGMQVLDSDSLAVNYPNSVLGYQPRYSEYKTSVDRVHGSLMSYGSLNAFASPRQLLDLESSDFHSYDYTDLMYKTTDLDPICVLSYSAGKGSPDYDQFICDFNFDVKAVRNMSVYGTPNI